MAVSLADEFVKVIPTAVVAAGTLAAGWGVTERISARWDRVRKERELDLAAVTQFYATYGEFFVIWKIWTTFPPRDGKVLAPDEQRRQLVARAAAMEGSLEALLIKLAVERKLKDKDKSVLPRFREGLQCLRESIEDEVPLRVNRGQGSKPGDWLAIPGGPQAQAHKDGGPGQAYAAIKDLAGRVALIATWAPRRRSRDRDPDMVGQVVRDVTTSARYRGSWWHPLGEATGRRDR
jgi:hypothetical protein